MKFCTTDMARSYSKIAFGYDGHDELLGQCIVAATELITNYCRRDFTQAQHVETFTPYPNPNRRPQKFWVNEGPIVDGSVSIKYSYYYDWDNTDAWDNTEFTTPTYVVNNERGMITVFYPFTTVAIGALQVTYTGGYEADTTDTDLILVPDKVQQACAIQASFYLERFLEQETGQNDEKSKGQALRIDKAALTGPVPEARALLAPLRKTLIGSM